MHSTTLFRLSLLTVAAVLGGAGWATVDAAAVPAVASTTATSTAPPAGGLTTTRWRLSQGGVGNGLTADAKVEARVKQTGPLPEVGLGVSGVGDALTGTKLAMAQKLLEHPLLAKIIRPLLDFVSGAGAGADTTGTELLNPSYFGGSYSFPFAFRSNFFKSGNATAEPSDTKAAHAQTGSSNNEATSGDSMAMRGAKAVRSGGNVQHYRLAVAKHGRNSAPGPMP